MYTKEIKVLNSLKVGYLYFRDFEHPLAYQSDNSVYLHRHIASIAHGRWLSTLEHVHHINENKLDNTVENLVVCSASEHAKIHNKSSFTTCLVCGVGFEMFNSKSKFCSQDCFKFFCVKDKSITKALLDQLIPLYSWVDLGKMFSYSDVGIKKRAKSMGCNIPVRRKIK
jgi:hypothetical protein